MYEDINFEIISCEQNNGIVIVKLRIEDTFEKYFTFCMGLEDFNGMNIEELEMQAYRIARQRVNSYKLNKQNFDTKINEFKNKINTYNEKIK